MTRYFHDISFMPCYTCSQFSWKSKKKWCISNSIVTFHSYSHFTLPWIDGRKGSLQPVKPAPTHQALYQDTVVQKSRQPGRPQHETSTPWARWNRSPFFCLKNAEVVRFFAEISVSNLSGQIIIFHQHRFP